MTSPVRRTLSASIAVVMETMRQEALSSHRPQAVKLRPKGGKIRQEKGHWPLHDPPGRELTEAKLLREGGEGCAFSLQAKASS